MPADARWNPLTQLTAQPHLAIPEKSVKSANYNFTNTQIEFVDFGGGMVCVSLPYLTLPYWEDVLPSSAEASNGPNAHPRINRKVTKSQVQYSPGSIPTRGTIPLPSEGLLTLTYPLTHTISISKRMSGLKADKHIHPGHYDQQNSKPGKSRRPIPESNIKPQNP